MVELLDILWENKYIYSETIFIDSPMMSLSKETNKDDSPFESYRYDVLDRLMSIIGTGQRWHKNDNKVCTMRYIGGI